MKIDIVSIADDWEGLYVDGTLIHQGHRITIRDVMEQLDASVEFAEREAWGAEYGECPDSLEDVVFDGC